MNCFVSDFIGLPANPGCNQITCPVRYSYYMKSLSLIFVACLFMVAAPVWAEGNSIRGVVTDAQGKPVAGAEIRVERTDAKGPAAVVMTDAKGQYSLNHLATGNYKVVASVSKTPRSAASVKTSSAGWVKVDFALKDSFAGPQRRDGSATDRVQGQDLRRMQQDQAFGAAGIPAAMMGRGPGQ
jgi:hypothetical protein